MITLGGRSFGGPYLSPVWTAPRTAGLFAVLVPGWRLLTFRALHFGEAGDLSSAALLKRHPRYADWVAAAGTDWNLYVATHEMPFSTQAQRQAAERELASHYRPEFSDLAPDPQMPGLKTLLLAQPVRHQKG